MEQQTNVNWFTDVEQPGNKVVTYGRAWDGELVLLGHANDPFIKRSGVFSHKSSAGVLILESAQGSGGDHIGFRPTIVINI